MDNRQICRQAEIFLISLSPDIHFPLNQAYLSNDLEKGG